MPVTALNGLHKKKPIEKSKSRKRRDRADIEKYLDSIGIPFHRECYLRWAWPSVYTNYKEDKDRLYRYLVYKSKIPREITPTTERKDFLFVFFVHDKCNPFIFRVPYNVAMEHNSVRLSLESMKNPRSAPNWILNYEVIPPRRPESAKAWLMKRKCAWFIKVKRLNKKKRIMSTSIHLPKHIKEYFMSLPN